MPRVAASEREAYFERRREEILEAAVRLFAEKGFDGASIEAIAHAAGLAKGTVYLYYPSKQALLDEVMARFSLLPDVERVASQLGDHSLEEIVPLLVRAVWARLMERRTVIRLLFREMPAHLDHAKYFLEKAVIPGNLLIARLLEEKLGPERSAEINTIVAGRGLVGSVLIFFLSQEVLGGAELLPIAEEDIASTITEVFLHGVLPSGGGTPPEKNGATPGSGAA